MESEKKMENESINREEFSVLQEPGEEPKKSNLKKEVFDFLRVLVLALLITNLLNVFVFTLSQVRQSSMESTLIGGDQLVVEKLSYTFGDIERGDIIVFMKEPLVDSSAWGRFLRLYEDMFSKVTKKERYTRLVKRVIGLPGDEIIIREGKVFINGKEYEEGYVYQMTQAKSLSYPLIVPENQFFVLGDNRGSSYDSRDMGCINREQVEGKVWVRFWPLNKFGGVK